jgi:tripartite-type tricarboxylate transporter receptor subunit TctC
VPQAAGSATDNIARLVAPSLAQRLGQPVVVDNRPGGALTIGIDAVAKAPPDGYTIGMGPVGALAITRHMVAKLPYDIERDLQPVALITTGYMLLAVSTALPVYSVRELIDYAKKNPGKLSNASSSNGSPGHVSGELFKYLTGTDIVHVPYKGGAAAIADLIAGNVQLMFESTNSIAPHIKAGRVRALAVSGTQRSTSLPELPTLAEAGVPGYEVTAWTGVIAPAGLPRAVLDRLNAAVNAAIASPELKERLFLLGSEGGGGSPEDYAELIRRDSAKWADVVRRSGARID